MDRLPPYQRTPMPWARPQRDGLQDLRRAILVGVARTTLARRRQALARHQQHATKALVGAVLNVTAGGPPETIAVGWWSAPKLWRALQVRQPSGKSGWIGPIPLDRNAAVNWRIDSQHSNWNAALTLWTYENGRWRVGP